MNQKATTALSQLGQIIWGALSKVASSMFKLGADIISGLLKGMMSMAVDLVAFMFRLSDDMKNAVKKALGVASPSKVMMEIGQNVVAGFNKGVSGMGGLGVNVNGASVNGSAPTLNASPAMAGGGGITQNYYITVAKGTPDQQVKEIMHKIGKASKRRGATGV